MTLFGVQYIFQLRENLSRLRNHKRRHKPTSIDSGVLRIQIPPDITNGTRTRATQMLAIQICRNLFDAFNHCATAAWLMITGHPINSSSCGIYSSNLVPHTSTILRGQCLTSVTDVCGWSPLWYSAAQQIFVSMTQKYICLVHTNKLFVLLVNLTCKKRTIVMTNKHLKGNWQQKKVSTFFILSESLSNIMKNNKK